MNRIYKVIWSHVKQCYVVTSELTKAHGRTSIGGGTSRLAVAALTAFVLTAGVTGVGLAADPVTDGNTHYFSVKTSDNQAGNYDNDGAKGQNSIAVGAGASADGRLGAVAFGNYSNANGERALAIGHNADAEGMDTIAIGYSNDKHKGAKGTNSIAIGAQADADGTQTIFKGHKYTNDDWGNATALGAYTEAGTGATALGASSQARGWYSTAVGMRAEVSAAYGVALGNASDARREADGKGEYTYVGYSAGAALSDAEKNSIVWHANLGAVSIGNEDYVSGAVDKEGNLIHYQYTRQLTGLAAGTEDTDAVNVAQLKSARTHFYSVNSEDASAGNYNNDGAKGKSAINAIAAGVGASSDGDSSIAVGTNSRVASNGYNLTSIAIGKNAYVLNGTGQQEYEFGFDKNKWSKTPQGLFSYKYDPKTGQENAALADIAGGIAIGTNSYARTGSIDIGGRTMDGRTMAGMVVNETWVDPADGKTKVKNPATANIIDMTTVGTNSYNKGLMATIVGSYSINTGDFNGYGGWNSLDYGSQNMGSTIVGSLNQNRSLGKNGYSGIANSIIGVANVAENANGALIFGAGNNVKNSNTFISGFNALTGVNSVDDMVNKLAKGVRSSKSGGATLVIGGGNTAENTLKTQIMGVNNTVTGTEDTPSNYNMIDGFNNTVKGASHLYTIGTDNVISDSKNSIIFGDGYNTTSGPNSISGLTNSVIIGNSTKKSSGYVPFQGLTNIVSLGNGNIMSKTDGAIAIGNDNFMKRDGAASYGYDTGNVAIGNNTYINSYVNQGDSIVIGKNATANNMNGSLEKAFAFGTSMGKDYSGSIAIGQNAYARSGSTMIGIHDYQGTLGDLNVDFTKGKSEGSSGIGNYQESIDATTIGNNSYNNGVFSTVVGSYTAVSGLYHNQKWGEKPYGVQNFGAAVLGSLNSVEGLTSTEHNTAGMADSILGSANRTKNANGTIMVGAGNVVEDSINDFDASEIKAKDGIANPNALSEAMRTSIKNANGGGAAAIVGNGNEVKKSTNVAVMGSKNTVTDATNSQIFGDNRVVTGADGAPIDGAVIIGSSDATTPLTTDKKNVTILGHNANATVEGGVALGAGSVASVDRGAVGYDLANGDHSGDTTGVWKSKAAAVSVGDASKKITRQITNVAAGTQDTDAVNVAQLKAISNTVDASKTKYYSVRDIPFTSAQYAAYTNEKNDGAKEMGALSAGYMTYAGGIASTVTGSLSGIINRAAAPGSRDFRGATALSYGTFNINNNTENSGAFSGVANSIVGQANMTTDSNAALIYGAGNVISNSYRDIDISKMGAITGNLKNPEVLGEALQAAVPTSGGQVMAFGGGNVVDNAYMSQVMGVGNTVKGNQTKNADGTWSSNGTAEFNDATSSQLNYVDGFYTTLINGKNDYLIGAHNTVTGDSVEKNHSNIVIGDNHTLENQSNNIILGSADNALSTAASQVTILGHNANATVNGGVALGYGSIANRGAGSAGLDMSIVTDGKVGGFSTDTNPVWKSNAAAVSVGNIVKDSEGKLAAGTITRQITGVAAGSEDYDAVNVAQLRQVVSKMHFYTINEGDKVTITDEIKHQLNKENDGAKKDYGMAAGYMTYTTGVASTVGGSFSTVTTADAKTDAEKENVKYQGTGSVSYGTYNYNRNTDVTKKSSGVVNSLVGQNNLVENSNAAQIYGSANSVTNSYRHINMEELNSIITDGNPSTNTPDEVMAKMKKAITDEKTGGMVTVVGSGNTANTAYMTQIQGVSNTVTGQESADESKLTTHNYVGGFFNRLENGKSNYVIGTKNTVTSSSDSTANASNIIIGDNHKLTNGSHNVIIGSEDAETPAVRHGLRLMAAAAEEPSKSPDNVVRIGHNAKATYDYSAALGAGSVASTKAGVPGYDPLTGKSSTSTNDITWTSNWAAASIGDSTHTRQLTNVAAGWADTDAVNVAQLRAVASKVGSVMNLVAGDGISIVNKDGVYTISANIKGGSTPTDDVKVDPEKPGKGGNTSGSTTDTPVTPVDPGNTGNTDNPGNTGNTENPGNTDNPSNGSGLIITAETKPTHFGADSGDATAVKPGETLAIKGDTTNITTTASDHGITVSLNKDIAVDSVTAGDTKMTSDGLTITGGPSITKSGINAGDKKVTHVADGEISADSKDAVNGSQLYRVQKNVESIENNVTNLAGDVTNLNGRVSDLDNRVNKVGAGAAALAALHPLDFNPDDKWNFAVGYGNYRNANSVAVGAFYQPNENTMFNVATNFGNGENMINAGVSFKIGKGNSYAGVSKAQLVAENQQLKANDALQDQKIQKQDQEIQELKKALEELKSRIK